jgi:arginyl-tRNA synthetase
MLRLKNGKMSSRTGNVITAISLIDEAKEAVRVKIASDRGFSDEEREAIAEAVAVGAIKYAILRQEVGRDMIFDFETSLSFDGDSGPYLQYTYARARSILVKANAAGIATALGDALPEGTLPLARAIGRFPEVVVRSREEHSPHHIANYLIDIARSFNSYYGNTVVLDGAADVPSKLAVVGALAAVLRNGLWLLGVVPPERM